MITLWKLTELQLELERSIVSIQEDETLTESDREARAYAIGRQSYKKLLSNG